MYDKYSKIQPINPGQTKLPKHKALLVAPNQGTSDRPGVTMWAYNNDGSTQSIHMTFASNLQMGPQIFPVNVYAVTGVCGASMYTLN